MISQTNQPSCQSTVEVISKTKHGIFDFVHRDAFGNIIETWSEENLILTAGISHDAKLFNGVSSDAFTYINIGSGSTAATIGDVALTTPYTSAGDGSATTSYVAPNIARLYYKFTFTATVTITEAGVSTAPVGGEGYVLYCHDVFTGRPMNSGETLEVTYSVQKSDAS